VPVSNKKPATGGFLFLRLPFGIPLFGLEALLHSSSIGSVASSVFFICLCSNELDDAGILCSKIYTDFVMYCFISACACVILVCWKIFRQMGLNVEIKTPAKAGVFNG